MNAQEIKTMMKFMSDNGMMLNETAYGALMVEVIDNVPCVEWRNLPLVERENGGSTFTELSMRDAENGYRQYTEEEADMLYENSRDGYSDRYFTQMYETDYDVCPECHGELGECDCEMD